MDYSLEFNNNKLNTNRHMKGNMGRSPSKKGTRILRSVMVVVSLVNDVGDDISNLLIETVVTNQVFEDT
jgi:hypothetical protein